MMRMGYGWDCLDLAEPYLLHHPAQRTSRDDTADINQIMGVIFGSFITILREGLS